MSDDFNTITVKLLDRDFKVKCPHDKVNELQKSARHLDSKMREISETGDIQSVDRIAVIAALNLTNDYLIQKQHKNHYLDAMNQRIQGIQLKVETALAQQDQKEL